MPSLDSTRARLMVDMNRAEASPEYHSAHNSLRPAFVPECTQAGSEQLQGAEVYQSISLQMLARSSDLFVLLIAFILPGIR